MFKIAICDDDVNYRTLIRNIISDDNTVGKNVLFFEYPSGESLLADVHQMHNLLFLDIQMSGLNGNETAKAFRKINKGAVLIFCTNYQYPTTESFKVQPYRYVMKDINNQMLIEEMPDIIREMESHSEIQYLNITEDGRLSRISIKHILYISVIKRGCLILPELGGHNMQGLGGFSNVYECADEIITSIRNHRIEELDCIYGISLGASIAIEIALRDCIRINKLILDGGQFESMGIMKKIDAYFMAKEFQKVIQKKRMWSYVSKQMGYRNGNEIEVLYPLCCKRIQFDTLYDAALAAYGYDIKKRMEKLRMKVVIMYGGNELFAAKSVSLVKEKCVSEFEVYAYDNMGHSEVLSLHPEKLCEIIRK